MNPVEPEESRVNLGIHMPEVDGDGEQDDEDGQKAEEVAYHRCVRSIHAAPASRATR